MFKTGVVVTQFGSKVSPSEGGGGVLLWSRAKVLGPGPGGNLVVLWWSVGRRCSGDDVIRRFLE